MMTTPQLQQLLPLLPTFAGQTDAEVATAVNATVTTRVPFYANARTLYALAGPVAGKAIMDALQASDPHLYAIMERVGPNDGSAGGVDVSLDSTREFIDAMVPAVITSDQASAIKALGETVAPAYPGLAGITESDVAAARAMAANQAAAAAKIDAIRAAENARIFALESWVAGGCVGAAPEALS